MACLEMYNNSEHNKNNKGDNHHHHHQCAPMSPRISFSNDFVDVKQAMKQEQRGSSRSDAPVSSDFEFSVANYSMMSADELFFKGRLMSTYNKDNCNNNNKNNHMMMMQQQRATTTTTTTLKEELLINDDDHDHDFSLRPPKPSSTRWKGLLGLRKTHIGSKKPHKSTEGGSSDATRSALVNDSPPTSITSSQVINLSFFGFISFYGENIILLVLLKMTIGRFELGISPSSPFSNHYTNLISPFFNFIYLDFLSLEI